MKPEKVLILGSGALKIGEAGEFDYSGSQAIKAMKEEGIYTVLVNPNIATIQTSEGLADRVYLLPVTVEFVEKVIERERPDGIFLSFGGQTALNCGLELERIGILEKYRVKVLGTPVSAIALTEDRKKFADFLARRNIKTPLNQIAYNIEEARELGKVAPYPLLIRSGFALGGLGAAVCEDFDSFCLMAERALELAPQILIDEYLGGYKEIEYEVVRDFKDNCITVCNMENFDPLGIHTGESIVVAPSQTLNDREYQNLRNLSIEIVRGLGIIGECNVQFALDPHSEDYKVIEVNARLSRSSALASKATGYPLAFVAAKLGLEYSLPELKNSVTRVTTACFEPALDYITVKIPKWDLKKFRRVSKRIGPGMKSVGEVMAIGRNFEEALQKAIRMVDSSYCGISQCDAIRIEQAELESLEPTDMRIFAVFKSLMMGTPIDEVHEKTRIDRWFLYKLENIVKIERELLSCSRTPLTPELMKRAKKAGYSDLQLGKILRISPAHIRSERLRMSMKPCIKQIDTLAAEYPAQTNYLYSSYHGSFDDLKPAAEGKSILVLGSGAYKIGSSVEFDWCCVTAIKAFRELGIPAILINNNPETVSTDYDECDRLYFEELSLERVLDICDFEKPLGVVLSMGGQIPNNLALKLAEHGIPILGTDAKYIDQAEDRTKFSSLLDELGIGQPKWTQVTDRIEAFQFASQIGYPVIVRPSYVLSGSAMGVATDEQELGVLLRNAADISSDHPVVLSKFVQSAIEVEFDGVGDGETIIAYAISEHLEHAGVHSGDATLVCPPHSLPSPILHILKQTSQRIVEALKIRGPFNIQYLVKDVEILVIECNLRASRSFPFISKVTGFNFITTASRAIAGKGYDTYYFLTEKLNHFGVKAPQFSFTRLTGADPFPGIEMTSTGEVGCIGTTVHEAFLKALLSVGFHLPLKKVLVSAGPAHSKKSFLDCCRKFEEMGIEIVATTGTHSYLEKNKIKSSRVAWPGEEGAPICLETLKERTSYDLVINIPKNFQESELTNTYRIRRKAVDLGIPLLTNLELAIQFALALEVCSKGELEIRSFDEYYLAQEPEMASSTA
jgi:carbamoyl-phosphate synthase large subunit